MRGAFGLLVGALVIGCDDGSDGAPSPDGAATDAAVLDVGPVDMRGDAPPGDMLPDGMTPADLGPDAAPVALVADAGADRYAEVGEAVALDGSASTGATRYLWDFGNGERWEESRESARAEITYARPGRYRATLTAIGPDGARRTDQAIISVTWPVVHAPAHSTTILRDGAGVAALVPAAGEIVRIRPEGEGFAVAERISTCVGAARVARLGDAFVATCPRDDRLALSDGADLPLRYGARPFGIITVGERLYVTLQGTGELIAVERQGEDLAIVERWPAVADARGLGALPDGRIVVTRWRSVDGVGRAVVLDPADGARRGWRLANDPQPPSDTEIGGVPSYLDQPLVAPTGAEVAFGSLQANLAHGPLFDGEVPAFDTVLRAVVSIVDPATDDEDFAARKQFDGRGFASAGAYTARGDFLFLAMRGSRVIERLDRLTDNQSGTLVEAGIGVDGVALSADDRWLFANAALSREVRIWDVSDLSGVPLPVQTIPLVEAEPLEPALLLGEQLFNDSFDPRLSREGYIACAHCHLDGDSDRLNWDFTARGEGLRNTISMLGRAGTGHGPIHWSGNFDEIQDFEHDIRGPFGGLGLMDDAAFAEADTSLGAAKAGRSAALDALAAYAASLTETYRSPHKSADGRPTAAMARGEAVFERLACDGCHIPPQYTDSAFTEPGVPRLHDVGTLTEATGQRLGGPITGIDTPTLLGLFDGGPYLHDGSAETLRAVLFDRNPDGLHGETAGLSDEDWGDLEQFLLGLDGR